MVGCGGNEQTLTLPLVVFLRGKGLTAAMDVLRVFEGVILYCSVLFVANIHLTYYQLLFSGLFCMPIRFDAPMTSDE